MPNLHLKVNQIGYRPDAPIKLALLGAWMGTLGPLNYGRDERECIVMDAESGLRPCGSPSPFVTQRMLQTRVPIGTTSRRKTFTNVILRS